MEQVKVIKQIGRLRSSVGMRRISSQLHLTTDNLILPMFVVKGVGLRERVNGLPDLVRFSPDMALDHASKAFDYGIPAVLIFGIAHYKDELGSCAADQDAAVQETCRTISHALPHMLIITDVCLCQYTAHGSCALLTTQGGIDNTATLKSLSNVALSHAQAGAHMVAPSGMIDAQVNAIRTALDNAGFNSVAIMGYSAKYASAYYGPFRQTVQSNPKFSNRVMTQIPPTQSQEAIQEMEADIAEGADWLMVKPAIPYLDIIQQGVQRFNNPIAAYNVSGEYAMVKSAAMQGYINERDVVIENLTSIRRAGARAIITYHAIDAAQWITK